ncbi:hypothetical protein COT30_02750 [Candidatus Micrarchaeota archaeon CG08_land_8_20_14_0_20_49_17]|nr:MAG: hypothetical protein AUJ13_00670 [Candidatus Micrarchaeota archaeon CG1_02_49_24]PIU09758.1 MAG: hypothetical protein COT30_02750 [Candidatus Micrarchaeota archaeon CG08_land_8_20_14_0_20_49_17]PIU81707.1 MAG: hypothetical protein COS70_02655 [Candidatus Micrarchaeota archaeon CG06_land_8_20_14_3_00_50_6]PIZ98057.1 MAG: hypothetical protein COX84_02695 [Candidatus Micrarchaeota archaeon CG_4_10_14_0_2_um_filter_49_7]HII53953.1 hypothetical protein [Candidatus Micrarchaeota archaeon]
MFLFAVHTRTEEIEDEKKKKLARLCELLGLRSERDTEGTVLRVLEFMIVSGPGHVSATSLSRESGLNRITCLHHLKRLSISGLVARQHGTYSMSVDLDQYVEIRMQKMMEEFKAMKRLAREIETQMENE